MRKIEQTMLNAITSARTWSQDNTRLEVELLPSRSTLVTVILYRSEIARLELSDNGIINCKFTLAEYPTRTTISRINAILSHYSMQSVIMGIGIRKGEPEFRTRLSPNHSMQCVPILSDKWYSVADTGLIQLLADR